MTGMREVPARRRRVKNAAMLGLLSVAAVVTTLPLILIVFHLLRQGLGSVQLSFFTNVPAPPVACINSWRVVALTGGVAGGLLAGSAAGVPGGRLYAVANC